MATLRICQIRLPKLRTTKVGISCYKAKVKEAAVVVEEEEEEEVVVVEVVEGVAKMLTLSGSLDRTGPAPTRHCFHRVGPFRLGRIDSMRLGGLDQAGQKMKDFDFTFQDPPTRMAAGGQGIGLEITKDLLWSGAYLVNNIAWSVRQIAGQESGQESGQEPGQIPAKIESHAEEKLHWEILAKVSSTGCRFHFGLISADWFRRLGLVV